MRVQLRELQNNPMRDFVVDPIDNDVVAKLQKSIAEDGFWGGIVCRKVNGLGVQIAAGHHRVKAAIKAGIDSADIFVAKDMDDEAMIRVYARENATQRGSNSSTAVAGSIASAVRWLAGHRATAPYFGSCQPRGHDQGIGQDAVCKFLGDLVAEKTVEQQLANLKASGDYSRIMREVADEIEEENREAIAALAQKTAENAKRVAEAEAAEVRSKEAEERRKEAAKAAKEAKEEATKKRAAAELEKAELAKQKAEVMAALAEKRRKESEAELAKFDAQRKAKKAADDAEKAAKKAEEKVKTFDFEGVAKHLKVASHVEEFRKAVTGVGIAPMLHVSKQAELAKIIVANLKAQRRELTGVAIQQEILWEVCGKRREKKQARTAAENARRARGTWDEKLVQLQHEFSIDVGNVHSSGAAIGEHFKKAPKGSQPHLTKDFRNAILMLRSLLGKIDKWGIV